MTAVRRTKQWVALWKRYARLGLRLGALAGDRRSRWLLAYLGATTLFRSGSTLMLKPVAVRVRLGRGIYPVRLQTRTELNVLYEVGLDDEYGTADDIQANTIVDLGAHVGLATLRLLSAHPNARVIAVEADPALIPRLRKNVAGLPVTVVHAAVCNREGEQVFYRSDRSSWGNSLDRTLPYQTAVRVPALSLSSLLESEGVERVDLLKVDVEGAEWDILDRGAPMQVAAIVGEIHSRNSNTPEHLIERLSESMDVRSQWVAPGQATFIATRRSGG